MAEKVLMASRPWVTAQLNNAIQSLNTSIEGAVQGAENKHTEVTSEDAKPTENNIKGDTCVVKTLISDDKYSYKAYVWNGAQWCAMDGNYSADNIIIDENITLAGDYDKVGNLKLSSGTINSAGMTLKDLLTQIFTKELEPTTLTGGSIAVAFTNDGDHEVGEQITPSYKITFSSGSFTYGSMNGNTWVNGTGITSTSLKLVDSAGKTTDSATSGTAVSANSAIYYSDTSNFSVTGTGSWTASNTPATNLKKASTTKSALAAVSNNQKTASISTGYRKYFWYNGSGDNSTTIDSAFLRSTAAGHGSAKFGKLYSSGTKYNDAGVSKDLAITSGTTLVVIAVPQKGTAQASLTSVIDVDGMGLDIKGNFSKETIQVYGANNQSPINYTVFKFYNSASFAKSTFKFTIAR